MFCHTFFLQTDLAFISQTGRLLHVSVGKPAMPAMMLPSRYKHNYTATIRVVVEDKLGTAVKVNVQFKVRMMLNWNHSFHNDTK